MQNLILQGYNAIVINSASPDALNGVIKQACDAGIIVVSFDGIVTEPCAYRVVVDFKDMGKAEVKYLAEKMPQGGNLLEIRGLAGTSIDAAIHDGIAEGVKENPQFKIVGSVNGNWAEDVAQKEVAGVLPSLPEVKAIVDQGGDGYGAAQAFKDAGRPTPLIIMGNPLRRARMVEGAEPGQRLHHHVGLDRAGRLDPRFLGGAAAARRAEDAA